MLEIKEVPCRQPRVGLRCYHVRTLEGVKLSALKEYDAALGRWHVSVGAFPRGKPTTEELMEVQQAILPDVGRWFEEPYEVNPYVRHIFELLPDEPDPIGMTRVEGRGSA